MAARCTTNLTISILWTANQILAINIREILPIQTLRIYTWSQVGWAAYGLANPTPQEGSGRIKVTFISIHDKASSVKIRLWMWKGMWKGEAENMPRDCLLIERYILAVGFLLCLKTISEVQVRHHWLT
jgi:hypothetical protein